MTVFDAFNAFVQRSETTEAVKNGPLTGETLGVKDIFDVEGVVSGWGNPQKQETAAGRRRPSRALRPA